MHDNYNKIKKIVLLLIISLLSLSSTGCIKKLAMGKIANALTSESGTTFSGDNDPLLIRDALPFTLKTYESLLAGMPKNDKLLLATGKSFSIYAYAFIHAPADTMPDSDINQKRINYIRAKKMYLRARGYLLRALEVRHPGFNKFIEDEKSDSAVAMTSIEDLDLLYWTGMSWMGAFTVDKFDMSVALGTPTALKMLNRVLEIDETYGNSAIHDFFISYYGGMPVSIGGSEKKAREHFKRSIELSKGRKAGPYISLATTVSVANQNIEEFKDLINKAIAIDAEKDKENTLANIISQIKAHWLLRNIKNYFLMDESNDSSEEIDEFKDEEF